MNQSTNTQQRTNLPPGAASNITPQEAMNHQRSENHVNSRGHHHHHHHHHHHRPSHQPTSHHQASSPNQSMPIVGTSTNSNNSNSNNIYTANNNYNTRHIEEEYIPLPIQTFLWRNTNPFVKPREKRESGNVIEQRDSCKLFERIIITNNVWGQSPSLTDAIASIDRWRLIKVSFPFVLQSTATQLNNKFIKDCTLNKLGSNESKMLYCLQWILMNASEECADSENEAKNNALAAAVGTGALLKPPLAASGATNSTSQSSMTGANLAAACLSGAVGAGIAVGQPIASQGSSPSCTSTTMDQQHQQQSVATNQLPSPGPGGSALAALNQSIMMPAASAAVAVAVPSSANHNQQQTTIPTTSGTNQQQQAVNKGGSFQTQITMASSSSVSPIGSSTPTKPLTPTIPQLAAIGTSNCVSTNNYLLPISSIQMFVYYFAPLMEPLEMSDFLKSNQRLEIGVALWEPLFNYRLPNVQCLSAPIIKTPRPGAGRSRSRSRSKKAAFFGNSGSKTTTPTTTTTTSLINRQHQGIPEQDDDDQQQQQPIPCQHRQSLHHNYPRPIRTTTSQQQQQKQQNHHVAQSQSTSAIGAGNSNDRRRSSSVIYEHSQFGDVFIGAPTTTGPQSSCQSQQATNAVKQQQSVDASQASMPTGVQPPTTKKTDPSSADLIKDSRASISKQQSSAGTAIILGLSPSEGDDHLMMGQDEEPIDYATYLDIAVLKCLLMSNWQESGIFWALSYINKRFDDFDYSIGYCSLGPPLPRSKSMPSLYSVGLHLLAQTMSKGTNDMNHFRLDPLEADGSMDTAINGNGHVNQLSFENKQRTNQHSLGGNYLRIDDPDDPSNFEQQLTQVHDLCKMSPSRRLSFSSGMQTLANQLRKGGSSKRSGAPSSSKRDHTNDNGMLSANEVQSSDLSRQSPKIPRLRRSSSADDLTSSQISGLASAHKDTLAYQANNEYPAMISTARGLANRILREKTESHPIITITSNSATTSNKHQPKGFKGKAVGSDAPSNDHFNPTTPTSTLDTTTTLNEEDDSSSIKSRIENQFLIKSLYLKSLRRLDNLTRSYSIPKDLNYSSCYADSGAGGDGNMSKFLQSNQHSDSSDSPESLAAASYVDDQARLNPFIILKITHSIIQRESVCSLRVCDKILSLINKLTDIGILKETFHYNMAMNRGEERDLRQLLPTRQYDFTLINDIIQNNNNKRINNNILDPASFHQRDQNSDFRRALLEEASEKTAQVFKMLIDIILYLYHHSGCPNSCGLDSIMDQLQQIVTSNKSKFVVKHSSSNQAASNQSIMMEDQKLEKNFRPKLRNMMAFLHDHNQDMFLKYVKQVMNDRSLQEVVDMLHSLLGFCKSDYIVSLMNLSSSSTTTTPNNPNQSSVQPQAQQQTHQQCVQFSDVPMTEQRAPTISTMSHQESNVGPRVCYKKRSGPVVESEIINNTFKLLVTRMSNVNKKLKLQENTSLYCDIRRLISFVRDNNSGTFRAIVLGSLIDCTKILNQQRAIAYNNNNNNNESAIISSVYATTKRPFDDVTGPPSDDEGTQGGQMRTFTGGTNTGMKHKIRGGYGGLDTIEGGANTSEATYLGRSSPIISSNQQGVVDQSPGAAYLTEHRTSQGSYMAATNIQQGSSQSSKNQENANQAGGILSLSKAKKKLEQVFGGKPAGKVKLNSSIGNDDQGGTHHMMAGIGGGGGDQATTGDETSRRTSIVGNQSVVSTHDNSISLPAGGRSNQMMVKNPAMPLSFQGSTRMSQLLFESMHTGMTNFSFLMESSPPGEFLDPALLAALLDLKSPIAIRAAIFLECSNLVHRCNRGHWPSWMKMNIAPNPHRGSTVGLALQVGGAKYRKSSSIQRNTRNNTLMYRAAGKAFYSWAEAVGVRLEELLSSELDGAGFATASSAAGAVANNIKDDAIPEDSGNEEPPSQTSDHCTNNSNSQMIENPYGLDVDFFQSSIGNNTSPFALKMAACQLLYEVTTFLRETYRYLPPSIASHQVSGSKLGDKMSSIYDVSRAVTANRRWSMALSSLGFGQLPATLSALSTGGSSGGAGPQPATPAATSASGHLRNPTSTSIPEHPERRISFILHESNDETNSKIGGPEQTTSSLSSITNNNNNNNSATNNNSNNNNKLEPGNNQTTVIAPLATSVTTNDQQQEAIRKMTGRNLSQSSASNAVVVAAATCLLRSSGMIDNSAHRRKSIKLKKPIPEKDSKEKDSNKKTTKFAGQDMDDDVDNSSVSDVGIRRTDSLRSRRRVSGISEKSDASDRAAGNNGINLGPHGGGSSEPRATCGDLSGDEASMGNNSCDDAYGQESVDRFELDQGRIMFNMPWFKAISLVNSNIDCECNHFPGCRSQCYKLHQDMCKRLISSVQTIYLGNNSEDEANLTALLESKLAVLVSQNAARGSSRDDSKKFSGGFGRAGSDCSANTIEGQDSSSGFKRYKDLKKYNRKQHQQQQQQQSETNSEDGTNILHTTPKSSKKNTDKLISSSLSTNKQQHQLPMDPNHASLLETLKALNQSKSNRRNAIDHQEHSKQQEDPPIVRYIRVNVKNFLHCPMSTFLKGAVILPRESFVEMIRFSWNLLLEDDQQLSRTAAVCFIISSIKCPGEASEMLMEELASTDASRKIAAINKFHVVWDARYQCWPRLEDGAFVHFKMAPPSIEFTLPSPKIAQESKPVVDPPWMPRKTSNVEEVTIGQDQTVQRSFVTATKTRRKQQIEIVNRALREKHDKLRQGRETYHITSVPVTLYAAYEPTLSNQSTGVEEGDGGNTGNADDDTQQENRALIQMKTAQALFPTCLCQAAIVLINLLDDPRVTYEGSAVYEVASKVIWSCLVEDPSLFLRYFFERLTRQNQSTIFQVLRRLIRFMPRLPPQAAFTLYNYLIGFVIYYIRSPVAISQKLIAETLSVLCFVVPSVYALFLKDLKQVFRKEQCDHSLLITANVPSAKKIIVHGSDSSGIPSQFPIEESTQFYHILIDSLEFFGIEKEKQNEYFLIDVRTNHMHNLHSYVRDHYSFKRSQHPQLQLISMNPDKAFHILQRQELTNQFLEFGKVQMTHTIVKSSDMAVGRALFLHEELMKLPTFPRRALETNFSLFRGTTGHQVFSMDRMHKIYWVKAIARMFELTSGFFLQLGEIHLFLNAVSGVFVLHCEEVAVSRLCLATFINAAYQFKNIFATDGFTPIMSTIVQVYSNHQNNQLLCRSIEFVCKQFYIMHRKPFLLQLFGSVASRLNTAEILYQNQTNYPISANQLMSSSARTASGIGDPNRISPNAFFRLLQSLEKAFKDPLDILELVDAEKPLKAVDFCYQQDKEVIDILDIISLCVTVTAYASDSPRSTQMLIILESVVPLYMKHLQSLTSKKAGQSMGKQAHKDEMQKIQSISVCIRTLIVNCDGLTRNFNGPMPYIDFRSSSIRRTTSSTKSANNQRALNQNNNNNNNNNLSNSPIDYNDDPSHSGFERSRASNNYSKQNTLSPPGTTSNKSARQMANSEEIEITRGEFIVPRDTLLNLTAEFLSISTVRLVESAKKYLDLHQKHSTYELLDVKSHLKLAEVANSLLKFASTDPSVMACRGLTRYMNEILPNTEWRQEAIRPALIMILKRLDKTFNRIAKKNSVKRNTDWEGAKQLLKGAYLTFIKHPYIVHLPHLKSLISCCQNIILSDSLQANSQLTSNFFHGLTNSATNSNPHQQQNQNQQSVSQSASMIMHPQPGEQTSKHTTNSSNLLRVSHQHHASGSSLTPSNSSNLIGGAGGGGAGSGSIIQPGGLLVSPDTQPGSAKLPSFVTAVAAATLAERLAANAASTNSITSQAFNSVTVRLIAMQLLQAGETQSLESLIGNSMNTSEKLESVMLNLIYPMCIRVCSGSREAPKLRPCDITSILNIVLHMLAPQSSSSKSWSSSSSSPKATSDTSQFILSKITTTIGSTQTGATALGIVGSASSHLATATNHQLAQHQERLKIGFLGLKILCVCFESHLAGEWIRISRVIRDLALEPKQPTGALWDFLDFVATYRFPLLVLLMPIIKCHLARKIRQENGADASLTNYNIQCQKLIDAKIVGSATTVCRSRSFLFVSLTAELRMLKEQLGAKRRLQLESERAVSSGASQSGNLNQAGGIGGLASSSSGQNQAGLSGQGGEGSGPTQTDHFSTYHRLSAAIAMFANQGHQPKTPGPGMSGAVGQNQFLGTSAALKGTCFAAQLAAPIGPFEGASQAGWSHTGIRGNAEQQFDNVGIGITGNHGTQNSMRLSSAKSREEARAVMNTILRRTSYPHHQTMGLSPQKSNNNQVSVTTSDYVNSPGRKDNQAQLSQLPSSSSIQLPKTHDLEAGDPLEPTGNSGVKASKSNQQIIMDPAMLMKAFPAPRPRNNDKTSVLKQLVNTIDKRRETKLDVEKASERGARDLIVKDVQEEK